MQFSARNYKNPIPELYWKTHGGRKAIAAWWKYHSRGNATVETCDIDTGESGREHKVKGSDYDLQDERDDKRQ